MDFSDFSRHFNEFISLAVSYWYILLPVSLAMIFGSRWFPKFALVLAGFFGGAFFLYPTLSQIQFLQDFIKSNPNSEMLLVLIVGIVCAIALLFLLKIFFFLAGLALGFVIGQWLWGLFLQLPGLNTLANSTPGVIAYGPIIAGGVFGLLLGFYAFFKQDEVVSFFSTIIGSLILGTFSIYGLSLLKPEWFGNFNPDAATQEIVSLPPVTMVIFLVIVLVLVFLGMRFSRPRGKRTA
ncbi:MAG TPA: hypothetical protein P5560_10695 [Thermotogota bacterium]|nr:hypothetical protein [Thermotogota bacterium]HRW93405.1 hypothetical protein [Thermotogota bacterium]